MIIPRGPPTRSQGFQVELLHLLLEALGQLLGLCVIRLAIAPTQTGLEQLALHPRATDGHVQTEDRVWGEGDLQKRAVESGSDERAGLDRLETGMRLSIFYEVVGSEGIANVIVIEPGR